MHKRIIWTLFLGAFILDFFRSRTTTGEPDSLPENNKEKEINIDVDIDDDKPKKPKAKKNPKINNEDLRNTYEENYEKKEKINKKRNKNFIDLRIEFCQS